MRRRKSQLPLTFRPIDHPHAREIEAIQKILDSQPEVEESVKQDLLRGVEHPEMGAPGMSAAQVLRALVVMRINDFSFRLLRFHLADSVTYRRFCGFGSFEEVPSRSTLADNIGKLRPETLEEINQTLVRWAIEQGIEDGRLARLDATAVETAIHEPSDSEQLWDGVRVLTRLLKRAKKHFGFEAWSDHTLRAKRRMWEIRNAKSGKKRKRKYRDLLHVARCVRGYTTDALVFLEGGVVVPREARKLIEDLRPFLDLFERVIEQTERRILHGESVPAREKVLSLFEPHTDLIIKDGREVHYGHKVYLSGGSSGLILDCVIPDGNPADSTLAVPLLKRHRERYGAAPEQATFDGGFASKDNVTEAKELGVKDIAFSKKRGLEVGDMVRESWIYKKLRDFRAGIEGVISFLKRVFGLGRCPWKGPDGFRAYVRASVLSANLLLLARHRMA